MFNKFIDPEVFEHLESLNRIEPASFAHLLEEMEGVVKISLNIEDEAFDFISGNSAFIELSGDEVADVRSALTGLHFLRIQSGMDVDEFESHLNELGRQHVEGYEVKVNLQRNLKLILDSKLLYASSKAIVLMSDRSNLYFGCSSYTDIRPIFDDNPRGGLLGQLVMHTLRFSFDSNGERQKFFLSLDTNDLEELQRVIERALEKAGSVHCIDLKKSIEI